VHHAHEADAGDPDFYHSFFVLQCERDENIGWSQTTHFVCADEEKTINKNRKYRAKLASLEGSLSPGREFA
jgi:hypothetical protein